MRVSQSARARQSFMREAMLDYPVPPREELLQLWNRFDYNGNGLLSLAEIDKLVREEYPQYDDKQALLRAYTFADADGSGFPRRWSSPRKDNTPLRKLSQGLRRRREMQRLGIDAT